MTDPEAPVWDDAHWLRAFLRDRNAECPTCGYNLRNLETPKCPECAEGLTLRVGRVSPRFGWLLLAVVPGAFSGVAATLIGLRIVLFPSQLSAIGLHVWLAEIFGVISAVFAAGFYLTRTRFLRRSWSTQAAAAGSMWLVHIAVFLALVITM